MSQTYIQAIRFILVGCANTIVGLAAIYGVMYWTHLSPLFANAVGYAVGIALSYTLNKLWTFNNNTPFASALAKYIICAALCYSFNIIILSLLIYTFSFNKYAAQLFGITTYTALMFVVCRLFVFRNELQQKDTQENQ